MGLENKLSGDFCLHPRCGEPLIIRPDKLPLCSKHAKAMLKHYARIRPDKVSDKTYLRGMPKTEMDE